MSWPPAVKRQDTTGPCFCPPLNLRDYPTVSAVNLLFATGVMAVNLAIDLIYPYLDPRVRYQ